MAKDFLTSANFKAPILLNDQPGATGQVPTKQSDGSVAWGSPGGGSPGGTGSQVQFRDGTVFGGIANSSVDLSGNLTLGSRLTSSFNNALNSSALLLSGTWVTSGGTSTTTKPAFLIEPAGTTSTGWPTAGTGFGINYPTGFTGWPFAVHQNGSLRFGIDAANNRTHINNTGGRGDIYLDKGGGGGDPRMVAINSTQTFAFTGMSAVTVPSLNTSSTTFILSGLPETIVYAFGIYSRCLGGASAVDQIIEGGCRPNFDEQNPGLRIRPIARGTAPSSTPTNATGSSLNLEGGNAFTNATNTANGGPITLNGGTSSGTGIPGNIVIGNNRGFLQIGRAVTVASLPAASAALRGSTAMVSDANAPAWGVAVAGGGSAFAMVWCNGTAWTVTGI